MIYKHLVDKIEECHAQVSRSSLIALEVTNNDNEDGKNSDFMQDFLNEDLEYICEVLEWKDDKETIASLESEIENSGLAYLMFSQNKGGFLAEVRVPNCIKFSYKNEGDIEPSSWQVLYNIQSIEWIYADTLDELSDKVVAVGEKNFKRFIEEDKRKEK
jgi:hypothetical protein